LYTCLLRSDDDRVVTLFTMTFDVMVRVNVRRTGGRLHVMINLILISTPMFAFSWPPSPSSDFFLAYSTPAKLWLAQFSSFFNHRILINPIFGSPVSLGFGSWRPQATPDCIAFLYHPMAKSQVYSFDPEMPILGCFIKNDGMGVRCDLLSQLSLFAHATRDNHDRENCVTVITLYPLSKHSF